MACVRGRRSTREREPHSSTSGFVQLLRYRLTYPDIQAITAHLGEASPTQRLVIACGLAQLRSAALS